MVQVLFTKDIKSIKYLVWSFSSTIHQSSSVCVCLHIETYLIAQYRYSSPSRTKHFPESPDKFFLSTIKSHNYVIVKTTSRIQLHALHPGQSRKFSKQNGVQK